MGPYRLLKYPQKLPKTTKKGHFRHFQASYTSQINSQLFYPLLDSLFTTLKIICALHSTLYVLALSAMQCKYFIFHISYFKSKRLYFTFTGRQFFFKEALKNLKSIKFCSENRNFVPFWVILGNLEGLK